MVPTRLYAPSEPMTASFALRRLLCSGTLDGSMSEIGQKRLFVRHAAIFRSTPSSRRCDWPLLDLKRARTER
jgi:hypothetical protein